MWGTPIIILAEKPAWLPFYLLRVEIFLIFLIGIFELLLSSLCYSKSYNYIDLFLFFSFAAKKIKANAPDRERTTMASPEKDPKKSPSKPTPPPGGPKGTPPTKGPGKK
jgi:hypothetical protein